jgi:putative ABC transport system permease protein
MNTVIQDLRYGVRLLLSSPGPMLIALLALTLGIGANTAIFSVVNAVVFRPLPFDHPDRLVMLREKFLQRAGRDINVSPRDYDAFNRQAESFDGIAGYDGAGFNLSGDGDPELIPGAFVTPNLFSVLGAKPILGRDFLPGEDQPGRTQVVMLSYGLWQRRFGSNPNVLYKTLVIGGKPYTVAGVMPRRFEFPFRDEPVQMWAPIDAAFLMSELPNAHFYKIVARLKAGVSIEQASAEMDAIESRIDQDNPGRHTGFGAAVVPLHQFVVGNVRPALLILLGAVALVMLIACANVANILLVKATARQREIAVRTALGATRGRVVRQLITESVLLSFAGGGLGLVVTFWGLELLIAAIPGNLPRAGEINIDAQVLGFTFAASVLTGAIFGLVPALQCSRPNLIDALKEGGRSATAGFASNRARSLLVVSEVALALVLLVSAGLMIKSFLRLRQVDSGFKLDHVLTLQTILPATRFTDAKQMTSFYNQTVEKLRELPGVVAAGCGTHFPLGNSIQNPFSIEGRPEPTEGDGPTANVSPIGGDYFQTLGISLVAGRIFSERDKEDAPLVAIIDQSLARAFFPEDDPLGKRISTLGGRPYSIVGIVASVKQFGLEQDSPPNIYIPYSQLPGNLLTSLGRGMTFAVRSAVDPLSVAAAARAQVLTIDKDQPVYGIKTMEALFDDSVQERRFNTMLLGSFSVVAMILATVGIYGVMSYTVAQRTHEIGIRVALGARPGDVVRMVVGQGMLLAAAGIGTGLVGALFLTRLMSTLLFGVDAADASTFALVSLLLAGVALAACYLPARRATSVDPMIALRYE